MYHAEKSKGRISIRLTAVPMGQDVSVMIYGGDLPHLGATAVSQSRPSLSDPNKVSATVSVITLLGHKEDRLAYRAASYLTEQLHVNTVVSCGIHMDDIEKEEFGDIERMVQELLQELVQSFRQLNPS